MQAIGCLFAIALGLFGLFQIWAGFAGIQLHWGTWWAVGIVVLVYGTRFTLPITIGAYLYARDAWGWPWYGALIFALPGLLFMIPGLVGAAIAAVRRH